MRRGRRRLKDSGRARKGGEASKNKRLEEAEGEVSKGTRSEAGGI